MVRKEANHDSQYVSVKVKETEEYTTIKMVRRRWQDNSGKKYRIDDTPDKPEPVDDGWEEALRKRGLCPVTMKPTGIRNRRGHLSR